MPKAQPTNKYPYKAFLSYHHDSDRELALEIKAALQRFSKPFYRIRACKVFLDQASLGVSGEGFRALQRALDQAEFLVLLASLGAAQSEWVNRELDHWFTTRDDAARKLVLILTNGKIQRSARAQDFDWAGTNALPKILAGKLNETPVWLDMTWARSKDSIIKNRERFVDNIATLHLLR